MNEALFGRTAAETQRPGALRLVSLSTVDLNAAQNITHNELAEVCVCLRVYAEIIFHDM